MISGWHYNTSWKRVQYLWNRWQVLKHCIKLLTGLHPYMCMYIYIYICLCACVCIIYVCMYVYIYISCTYVHIIYTPKVSWVGSNLLYLAAVWLLDYVCIYADIYIYIYTYIHIYIYTYIHIHIYTHIHIYPYTHMRIHAYTHTHIHIHIHTYTYIRIYVYIYIRIYIYVYTYIYTYITYLRLLGATSKRGIWKANDINIAIWKLDETGDGVPRATWISAAVTLSQWKTRLERSNVQDIWVCLKIVYP